MEETNKRTLIESLSALPEYNPLEGLWDSIDERLNDELGAPYSRQDLRELPTHVPADELWGRIEGKLENRGGRIIPMKMRRVLSIAASFALLFAAAFWVFNQNEISGKPGVGEDASISYSTEVVDDMLLIEDWNEDESAFEEFKLLCEAKKYVCEHPEFQILKTDLDELTEAKEAIQEAIGAYGTDPDLVIQIKEIELERTDLLKKMMVMLI